MGDHEEHSGEPGPSATEDRRAQSAPRGPSALSLVHTYPKQFNIKNIFPMVAYSTAVIVTDGYFMYPPI